MKNNVQYSPQALKDLDEIWDYIASDLQNTASAERMVEKILKTAERLETFPESGALLSSVADVCSRERFLICGEYLIFYHTGKSAVLVDRVLYGRRDYLQLLLGDQL